MTDVPGFKETIHNAGIMEQRDAPAPRVTPDSIEAKIKAVDYLWHEQLCVCVVTMRNGFKVVGKAAPASPENFNPEMGETFARQDAYRQIWPLEGYLLCERLRG